jgi:DNA-directed RNA polymerase specialized sigma24 family protein
LAEQDDSSPEESPVPAELLRGCLEKLPDRSKQLVQQRYFENLAPSVIASLEGRTANEIRQALFRLRAALHQCVTRQLSHPAVQP